VTGFFLFLFIIAVTGGVTWYLRRRRPTHLSIIEVLRQVVARLGLQKVEWRQMPFPLVKGVYFHYPIHVEGFWKKGYGFRMGILLPEFLEDRIFLQSEDRNASLRPIATLTLAHTEDPEFDRNYMLCSDNPRLARALFHPHLCGRIRSLGVGSLRLEIHGKEAILEMTMPTLQAEPLARWIEILAEITATLETVLEVSQFR